VENRQNERYLRQIIIEGFGSEAQKKLKQATVFIAGAGGLGCSVSLYLAAAGVGRIRIADHGRIELSNLNRQVLYTDRDIGKPKSVVIAERLSALNPEINIEPARCTLDSATLPSLVANCTFIVDALDNLPTRYALNKAALDAGIPLVHGAVNGFHGQLMTVLPGNSACLMCLYRGKEAAGLVPVIGTAPGTIGSLQATEAIRYITGLGGNFAGKLLVYDGLWTDFERIDIPRDPDCPHCGGMT
jgi:molybdopterin/thiamine biosynthesis adenylyltransferase